MDLKSKVFFRHSKAFDKVRHNGLIYKLKQNGVPGDLLNILTNFLKQRKQKVILNGQHSTWKNLKQESLKFQFLNRLFS